MNETISTAEASASVRLFVLMIAHHYGLNVSVHPTEHAALAAVDEFVEQWWEHEMQEPIPVDGVDREAYFESCPDESYVIEQAEMLDSAFAEAEIRLELGRRLTEAGRARQAAPASDSVWVPTQQT